MRSAQHWSMPVCRSCSTLYLGRVRVRVRVRVRGRARGRGRVRVRVRVRVPGGLEDLVSPTERGDVQDDLSSKYVST